jgi:2-polyprenyl-3-methyl-5-hydroxy-6-metoxy-1,4-benzoquinol methylase
MKWLDKFIQQQRFVKIASLIPKESRILDIGSHKGELFQYLNSTKGGAKDVSGVGIEPLDVGQVKLANVELIKGYFPIDLPALTEKFDIVTLLAVLEHVPQSDQQLWSKAIAHLLMPKGKLIITVPDKKVDFILDILNKMRLIEGMSLAEHYGFDAEGTPSIFTYPYFKLVLHQKFQFGLNNLFVFERLP